MSDKSNHQESPEEAAQLTDENLEEVAGGTTLQDIVNNGGCVFNPEDQSGTDI